MQFTWKNIVKQPMNLCFLKPEKLVIDFKIELEKMNPMEFQGLQYS